MASYAPEARLAEPATIASYFGSTSALCALIEKTHAIASEFRGTSHYLFLDPSDTPTDLEHHNSLLQARLEEATSIAADLLLVHNMTFDMVNTQIRCPFNLNDAIAYSVIRYGMQDRLFEAGRMEFGAIKSHLDVNPGLKREWEMAHSLVVGTPTTKERRSRVQKKWAKRIEALRLEGEVCSTAKLTLFVTQSKAMEELGKGPPAHQQAIESGGGPPADKGVEGKGLGIDGAPRGAVESSEEQPAGRLRQFDLPLR